MSTDPDRWKITDFAGGLIGGSILGLLGLWMLLDPDRRESHTQEDGVRLLAKLLDAVWSMPGGIVFVILGTLIFGATLHQLVKQYN